LPNYEAFSYPKKIYLTKFDSRLLHITKSGI